MGGGIGAIKGNNITNASEDLDLVYCLVDLTSGNQALFDRPTLFKKFSKVVGEYLEDNGVKYKIERPVGLGGGGFESFLSVLKELWSNKEVFGITYLIVRQVVKLFIGSPLSDKPRVCVSLQIKSVRDLDYVKNRDLEKPLIERLINLKNLSDGLCDFLKEQYPIFCFDQSFNAELQGFGFKVSYIIQHEQITAFNRSRLIRLFKSIKVKHNFDIYYIFNKFNFIERIDGKIRYEGGFWTGDGKKTQYYLFLSSRIISDYF